MHINIMKKALIVFTALATVVLCSCTRVTEELPMVSPPPVESPFEKMLSSVVSIRVTQDEDEAVINGSGVIIAPDTVLTCYHTVYGEGSIGLTPYMLEHNDGEVASCIWHSEEYDLAILKCDTLFEKYPQLTPIALTAEPCVGQTVYAVANNDGSGISVTQGIVSRDSDTVTLPLPYGSSQTLSLLRCNAKIGQGCSGGAFFDENGGLLGIINARQSETDIGWAIPSSIAITLANEVIAKGSADTMELGASFEQGSSPISNKPALKVSEALTGSVASAFLSVGDRVSAVDINSKTVELKTVFDLESLLLNVAEGDDLTFYYSSGDQEKSFTLNVKQAFLRNIE